MGDRHRLYRTLTCLYPRRFRRDYGADLVQHFADLVADRGARAAWARTGLDLTITVPRYHLEKIMTDNRSSFVLTLIIALLALGGVMSFLVDARLSPLLLVAAGALAVTQRSALARALRTPDTSRRRRRLITAAYLGATFAITFVAYLVTIGESWTVKDTLLSLVGTFALFAAGGFLIAGLATPRTPEPDQLAGTG